MKETSNNKVMKAEASSSSRTDQLKRLKELYTNVTVSTKVAFNREFEKLKTQQQKELQLCCNKVSQLKSQIYKTDREHNKGVAKLTNDNNKLTTKVAIMKCMNLDIAEQQSTELKTAIKTTVRVENRKERENQSIKEQQDRSMINKIRAVSVEQQCNIASLTKKVINAKRRSINLMKECQSQQLKATNTMNSMMATMHDNEVLHNRVIDLEADVEEGYKMLDLLKAAIPIPIIEKERKGKKWTPLLAPIYIYIYIYIYKLITEMLVNDTPPSTINDNIITHVKFFSPTIIIKELPSIWTIWGTRTVLLIVVEELLAAYCLGRSNKWQQLFTDATSRQ